MTGTDEVRTDWAAEGVFRVALNRPAKRNAITPGMVDALARLVSWAKGEPTVRAVVIGGAGEAFSAGADLAVFAAGGEPARAFLRAGNRTVAALAALGKPAVAAVDGLALGGGFEIALACSLRLASPRATFGLPEVTLGLMPAWGGVPNLVRAAGTSRALGACLTGQPISAAEAHEMGLVRAVVPAGELADAATALAVQLAKWSPAAVAGILELAREPGASWEREAELFDRALARPEAIAALARFARKAA